MDNRPILFLDSGVGGIPYTREFLKNNPQETVFYLADRENFPYGPKQKEEISAILISLTETLIKSADPKMAVLACNTASISALHILRQTFPKLPFVGTVPAIKPAALASAAGKVGVLATERTIEDIRGLNLETGNCEIIGVAAPSLVKFVEENLDKSNKNEKEKIVKEYIDLFKNAGADTLVLGCTHFLYLLDEFRKAASSREPPIKIFDSLEGITKRIEYLLDQDDFSLRAKAHNARPEHRLILSGEQPPESFWINRAKELEFNLCLLGGI
jgi:glutamate racemase